MQPIRVLTADGNPEIHTSLENYFRDKPEIQLIGSAFDGAQAYRCSLNQRPDVLITGLVLPIIDGMTLLERLGRQHMMEHLRVIVLSSIATDDWIQRAVNLGASYYMAKPFDPDILYQRILDLSLPGEAPGLAQVPGRPFSRAMHLLDHIGFPSHQRGYRYLSTAVELASKMCEISGRITKELYPQIAVQYNVNAKQVEGSIRYLIDRAWRQGYLQSDDRIGFSQKPSNGDLIARLAQHYKKLTGA